MTVREAIREALLLLTARDRRLLALSIAIQMATSILDLIGVLLVGLIGALAVTTVQSQPPPATVQTVADFLGMQGASDQDLVLLLSAVSAAVLLTKSVLSSYLTRRVLIFLANRQALVAARLTRELLSRPLTFVQRRSSQETAFALINGTGAATSLVLGQMVVAITELTLLIVLGAALLLVSPWVAVGAIAFFGLVALGLQRAMGDWAARVGRQSADADIASLDSIQEALGTYRETTVAGRRHFYVARIQRLRWRAAKVTADTQFIAMFPKYLFEAALVLGGFALAGVLFATQDSVTAVGTLALFLAAGTRVMPSLLRFQAAVLGLRASAGVAGPAFALANELGYPSLDPAAVSEPAQFLRSASTNYSDFSPSVDLHKVTFTYPGRDTPALTDVSLHVGAGQSAGLVGPSGAGKSTVADLMLGVLQPDSGTARLGGLAPDETLAMYPGSVAYVPQQVWLATDTIRANVALGLPHDAIDDDLVWQALERAHLATHLRESGQSLETVVGERGLRLSGGQRQRLGIARALYSHPRFLILDEATSALDAETELAITQMLSELEGEVTTVVVAHRLSTVRHLDKLLYINDGTIEAQGDFHSVLEQSAQFRKQARLMGLA